SQAVHFGHVDIGQHDIDVAIFLQPLERLETVVSKHELQLLRANLPPKLLPDERFEVRFVVNHQDLRCHFSVPDRPFSTLQAAPHLRWCGAKARSKRPVLASVSKNRDIEMPVLPPDVVQTHLENIQRDGYSIIENAIEPDLIDALGADLERLERELQI